MKPNGSRRSPSQKIELVLGGGGIKGFGHNGLLKAIEQKQVNIGTITGVSIGSAVAAFYANGYTPEEITEIFLIMVRRLDPRARTGYFHLPSLLRLLRGIDLKELFGDVIGEYDLKPRANLRILAYNVLKREPVVFEGTDYDLATAISASCSVPGVMRPVWYGQKDLISTIKTIIASLRGRTNEGILVDGGVHHPYPGEFCLGPAIISKLGVANSLPSEWLSPVDLAFHVGEVLASRLIDWYYPDPANHLVLKTGMPDVACLTFGLSDGKCREMVEYGYRVASRDLDTAIRQKRVPVIR